MSIIKYENINDLERFARHAVASRFFKSANDVSAAIIKAQYGLELGIEPVTAMQGIHAIEGKMALSSGLIAARIKASGRYDYRVARADNEACVLSFRERVDGKWEEIGTSSFTIAEARDAGVASKDVWRKYASDMLFARAVSRGARRFTPDVFGGSVYSPEEVETSEATTTMVHVTSTTAPIVAPMPALPPAASDEEVARRRREFIQGFVDDIRKATDASDLAARQATRKDDFTRLQRKYPEVAQALVDYHEMTLGAFLGDETPVLCDSARETLTKEGVEF